MEKPKWEERIRRVRPINSEFSNEAWILWTIAATPGYGSCSKRMQSNEKSLSSIKAEVTWKLWTRGPRLTEAATTAVRCYAHPAGCQNAKNCCDRGFRRTGVVTLTCTTGGSKRDARPSRRLYVYIYSLHRINQKKIWRCEEPPFWHHSLRGRPGARVFWS